MSIKINSAIINNSYNKSISSVSFTSKIARSGNSVSKAKYKNHNKKCCSRGFIYICFWHKGKFKRYDEDHNRSL